MARRRYQLSRCPECGTDGLAVTTQEPPAVGPDAAEAERRGSGWPVVAVECAHGCAVRPAQVALPA